jgi:hypothetical protein
MLKTIAAVLFAAAVSSAATIAPGLTGQAEPVGPHRSLKDDRLQIDPAEPLCPQTAWPYRKTICVDGRRQPASQPRETRVAVIALRLAERSADVNSVEIRHRV